MRRLTLAAAQKGAGCEYSELARQAYVRRMQEQRNLAANVARAGEDRRPCPVHRHGAGGLRWKYAGPVGEHSG